MLTISRASLVAALRALSPIVAGAPRTDPRFHHVLLDATDRVSLTAVSHDYALVGTRTLDCDPDGTSALVPHKWLLEAAEAMPGPTVRLEMEENRVTVSAGRSRMSRPALAAHELMLPAPISDLTARCVLTGAEIAYGLGQVAYAASTEPTRPALCTVLLEDTGGVLRFVAINGPQAALHVLDDDGGHEATEPFQISLPRESVPALRGFFGPNEQVQVRHGGDSARTHAYAAFSGPSASLRVRLPVDPYPTFAPLVDVDPWAVLRADRDALVGAVERAVIQQDKARTRFYVSDGSGHLEDVPQSALSEALSVQVECGEWRFDCNPLLLQAALRKVQGDTVVMERRGEVMIYLRGDGPHLHGFAKLTDAKGT